MPCYPSRCLPGYLKPGPAVLALLIPLAFACEARAARGRASLNAANTTFVADNGRLLRGAIISTETGAVPSVSDLEAIKTRGLNTVHCYAERWDYGYAAGARFAALDTVVQRTRDAGLYLVITVGNGGVNASFNAAFWTFYAPRYAGETHVLYEIQNEPGFGPPVSAAVITLQKDAYTLIRAHAPDTPVLLMSYMLFQNGPGVLQDMAALGSHIDWSNAAVAFHGYGEHGPRATLACLKTVLNAGYPCVQTEFYRWPWGTGNFDLVDPPSLYTDIDHTADLERLGVSWLSFLSLKRVQEDARFKNQLDAAGITWTPDFGAWPLGARSVYGNAGEPRPVTRSATTRLQAEDFDNGGQGVAYHDNAAINSGGAYRTGEGVDIQRTTDTGGGHNLGWIVAGEWLEYTLNVNDPGRYSLRLRVASTLPTNRLRVRFSGVDTTGAWEFPGTGGHQTWTTLARDVDLIPGQHVLRLEAVTSGFNLNWIELAPASSGPLANGAHQIFNRATLRAVEVADASSANGAKVRQAASYLGGNHQKWLFTHVGAHQYTITSAHTGKALDVASSTALSGDVIGMWPVKTTAGQRWLVRESDSGFHTLVSANSGLALGLVSSSPAPGVLVEQREYAGATHRQWLLRRDQPARYSAWTAQQFPLLADRDNPAVAGPVADPRGHGVPNLLRYALGLSFSEQPASRLPRAVHDETGLGLRFPYDPALGDLTYRVQASLDLADWSETLFDSRHDPAPPLVNGWLHVRDPRAAGPGSRRFLRLSVTATP